MAGSEDAQEGQRRQGQFVVVVEHLRHRIPREGIFIKEERQALETRQASPCATSAPCPRCVHTISQITDPAKERFPLSCSPRRHHHHFPSGITLLPSTPNSPPFIANFATAAPSPRRRRNDARRPGNWQRPRKRPLLR